MLERGGRGKGPGAGSWEKWEVVKKPERKKASEAPEHLTQGNHHFESWWDVPLESDGRQIRLRIGAVMGDGKTEDQWYAHLLTRKPKAEKEDFTDQPWKRPPELEGGDEIWVASSTFDFEFLDTTARRFEIAYDEQGRRRGRSSRPYLLEEIGVLQRVWDLVSQRLTTSQWMALDGLIEQKRHAWGEPRGPSKKYSKAFKRFVHDALCTAEWKWEEDERVKKKGWKMLNEQEQDLLKRAVLRGVLNDVINLYHEAMKEKGEE